MKPTDEQIKELWEWCGWQILHDTANGEWVSIRPDGSSYMSTTDEKCLPLLFESIDLNSLFKYAVPKLSWWKMGFNSFGCWAEVGVEDIGDGFKVKHMGYDPALALFWAIYPIVTGKEGANE